jgi:hypothetical protein
MGDRSGRTNDHNHGKWDNELKERFINTGSQMMLPGFEAEGLIGLVWPLPGGKWHAEIDHGWWVCVAANRKSAVEGVKKQYWDEVHCLDNCII